MHSKPKLLIADSASGKFLPRVLDRIDQNSFEISYPETEDENSLIKLAENVDAILCYQANISNPMNDAVVNTQNRNNPLMASSYNEKID